MSALIKILTGPQMGAEFVLPDGEYRIGISDEADLMLADVSVLPIHALLRVDAGECRVEPAVPGAEIWVQGIKIAAETPLRNYEVITLGGVNLAVGPDGPWEMLPTPPEKQSGETPDTSPKDAETPMEQPATEADANAAVDLPPRVAKKSFRPLSKAAYLLFPAALLGGGWWFADRYLARSPLEVRAEKTADVLRDTGWKVVFPAAHAPETPGVVGVAPGVSGKIAFTGMVGTPNEKREVLATSRLSHDEMIDGIRVFTEEAERAAEALRKEYPDVRLDADAERFVVNLTGMVTDLAEYARAGRLVRNALPQGIPLRNHLINMEDAQQYLEKAGRRLGLDQFSINMDGKHPTFAYDNSANRDQVASLRRVVADNYGRTGLELFAPALRKMEEIPPPIPPPNPEPEPVPEIATEPEPEPAPEPEPPVESQPEPPPPKPQRQFWTIRRVEANGFIDQHGRLHRVGAAVGQFRIVGTWSDGVVMKEGNETVFLKQGRTILAKPET